MWIALTLLTAVCTALRDVASKQATRSADPVLVAFVIAVKRTSTLFGVLLGHSLFSESHVRERLVGAAVMLAGFILVTLD